MKYGLYGILIPLLMKNETSKYLNKAELPFDKRKIKKEYKLIIKRQPDIGGNKNNLIMGVYTAAYFISVYKNNINKMNEEIFDGFVKHVCASSLFKKLNEGKDFFAKKNIETRNKLQNDEQFNSYSENWKYDFTYDLNVPECKITYTRCAICEMAKREKTFHLMKYLCWTDYAQQELMGNKLIRTKTIGNGDDICDFHIIGKKGRN